MDRCGHDCFEFDGGQPTETHLPSSAVVSASDPGDDRDAQRLSDVPAAPVQDVLLQQAEKRFHGRVITGSPARPSTRPCRGASLHRRSPVALCRAYGTITMANASEQTITTLPAELRRSLTWNRGKELSAHAQFSITRCRGVFR
jgi:hypothetical protein